LDIEKMVADLKRERDRLSQAIAALEAIATSGAGIKRRAAAQRQAGSKRRRRLTPEGRKRLSDMMKKRWAEYRKKRS
jgi:hypothetical protein